MTDTLPIRTHVDHTPRDRADLTVDGGSQGEALRALSSATAQSILRTISADPKPASEIATTVDTSIQNVQYHLQQLEANGLVEPAGEWYSPKGKAMTVYAPAAREFVVQFEAGGG